jgi:hypothetical protein
VPWDEQKLAARFTYISFILLQMSRLHYFKLKHKCYENIYYFAGRIMVTVLDTAKATLTISSTHCMRQLSLYRD